MTNDFVSDTFIMGTSKWYVGYSAISCAVNRLKEFAKSKKSGKVITEYTRGIQR